MGFDFVVWDCHGTCFACRVACEFMNGEFLSFLVQIEIHRLTIDALSRGCVNALSILSDAAIHRKISEQ